MNNQSESSRTAGGTTKQAARPTSTRERLADGRIREIVRFESGVVWERVYSRDGDLQSGRLLAD